MDDKGQKKLVSTAKKTTLLHYKDELVNAV
jgi:hypothetical protein